MDSGEQRANNFAWHMQEERSPTEVESVVEDVVQGASGEFHVVVLGTGPVGKTSLINALLGRSAGETGATMGTTRAGQVHTHVVEGVEGTLLLTDTPGLGEAGPEGSARELEAIELGHPRRPARFRRRPRPDPGRLSDRRRDGARGQAVDRRPEQEGPAHRGGPRGDLGQAARAARGLRSARGRRGGRRRPVAGPGPRPQAGRDDGDRCWKKSRPTWRLWSAGWRRSCEREGDTPPRRQPAAPGPPARAGRARRDRQATGAAQAAAIIERHQWLAAVTAFANPVLALGPMAVGAVQLRMLSEMAAVYDAPALVGVRRAGRAARWPRPSSSSASPRPPPACWPAFFKFNPLGFAAGGVVQAVTMAYLTRLTGASFLEYVEHGQTWGEGGMQATLSRQLEETRRSEWLLHFAKQAIQRLFRR